MNLINGLPISNYSIWQIKKYAGILAAVIVVVFLLGNILTAVFKPRIMINPESFVLKNGYPMFTSAEQYIKFVKSYPYNFGTNIKIYKISEGESYWDIAIRNRISMDTLIAANPFIDSLLAKGGIEIVIPSEDGVLMPFDNILDLWRMSLLLNHNGLIKGDYLQSVFKVFSLDDMRFAFFKGAAPEVVNTSLEKLYALRKIFQSPIKGLYTSMYGDRVNPLIEGDGVEFHNGIDINGRMGDPIHAAREGMVSSAGWRNEMGQCIIIQHLDGYETTYGHCSAINVKAGDTVTKQDIIGRIGSTGRSTGPHLHFMIKRHGQCINPLIFIW